MDIKTEIKEEDPLEVISETESKTFSQDVTVMLNNDSAVCGKLETKTEIKEETLVSEFSPQTRQLHPENPLMKLEHCHDDFKMEDKTKMNQEDIHSYFLPENQTQGFSEVPVVIVNPCIMNHEMDMKTDIKKVWCPERISIETPYADVTKVCVNQSFLSTESIRLSREAASMCKSGLLSDKNCGNNATNNMTKDIPECETARVYISKETDVPEQSSVQKNIYSEQHSDTQLASKSLCSKYKNFVHQSSTQTNESSKKNYCFKSVLDRDKGGKYKCEICEKTFTSSSDLKRHKLIHEGKKPYKCDVCDKSYAQLPHLKRHKLTHEGIRPFKCDTCGNCFTRLLHLERHKLTHEGIKPYTCDTCGNCFTQVTHLKRHMLVHQGIKPHKCDTCERCFTALADLKRHKLTHEGIKPHKCDTCGKCFTRLTDLKMHKLIHEGVWPHKCDACGKRFTGLRSFKRHKLTHEGIRPHKCDTCGKCFTVLAHLKRHKLTH